MHLNATHGGKQLEKEKKDHLFLKLLKFWWPFKSFVVTHTAAFLHEALFFSFFFFFTNSVLFLFSPIKRTLRAREIQCIAQGPMTCRGWRIQLQTFWWAKCTTWAAATPNNYFTKNIYILGWHLLFAAIFKTECFH